MITDSFYKYYRATTKEELAEGVKLLYESLDLVAEQKVSYPELREFLTAAFKSHTTSYEAVPMCRWGMADIKELTMEEYCEYVIIPACIITAICLYEYDHGDLEELPFPKGIATFLSEALHTAALSPILSTSYITIDDENEICERRRGDSAVGIFHELGYADIIMDIRKNYRMPTASTLYEHFDFCEVEPICRYIGRKHKNFTYTHDDWKETEK